MRFGVLGPLEVWTDDGSPVRVPELKVRALLAALLARDGLVPADRLFEDLWGIRQPAKPSAVLRTKVSQLRRALSVEPGAGALVVHRAPGYLLDGVTDADQFQELVTRAQGLADLRGRAALLTEALGLWRGAAFADFADEPFAQPAIARLTELRLTALEEHSSTRLELGEHSLLVGELAELVRAHPLRERLWAVYLRSLYRAGRSGEALAAFADLRTRLADELGTDPGPELASLHLAILRQDPALSLRPRGNLPPSLSEVIGRADAVTEVGQLVSAARLVTLTGPGGVGKTRLAIEAARSMSFVDGTWLVELDTPASPPEVVATVLGVRDGETGTLSERLAGALRHKQMLLVLDNCEQVVSEVARLAETLLLAAPGLRILATSRQPIGVEGERLWVVPPLTQSDAVSLFVTRAAAAGSTLDESSAVATICARLDGIPLALELAATRVRALGVRQLAELLDDRFRVLAAGRRDAPARQQTLRAVIDWSWDLLTADERVLLRRLAIFSGGCTLAAVEAVCAGDPDLLARLVDRSLVVVDGSDRPRYRLLESVAAYAMERLSESGEFDRVQRAHFSYFTAFAEQAELRGPGQREWLLRLDAEAGNLHAALDGAVRQQNADFALRLANATTWYRYLRGRWGVAQRALDLALAVDGPSDARAVASAWRAGLVRGASPSIASIEDPVLRAHAEWFVGFARIGFADSTVSRILAVFRSHGFQWGVAASLTTRAWNSLARSDLVRAADDASEALALFSSVGDSWGRMQAMDVLGEVAQFTGDYGRAAQLHQDGLRVAEDLELWPDVSYKLAQLGRIALLSGDYLRSTEFHSRALRLAAEQSDRFGEYFAQIGLALTARRQGLLAEASAHLDGWLAWSREIGWAPGVALVCAELGFIAELHGSAQEALSLHRNGFAAAQEGGDPRALALAAEGIAGAVSLAGDAKTAARLLGSASATRSATGAPLPRAERGDVSRISARAREALGEQNFAAEFQAGTGLSPAEIISTVSRESPGTG